MRLSFLGTGTSQGVPVIGCDCVVCSSLDFRDKRLRTSVHIEVDGLSLVVDTGPDFRQQMLRERVRELDAVLYTHEHKDHTGGMDEIRTFNFRQKKDMPVYGEERVINQLKQEFSYIFAENKYPGAPSVSVNIIENSPFFIKDTEVIPIRGVHRKLPVLGFRIKDLAYITDMNFISEEEKEKLKNCKVLILNALQKEEHISHFTLSQAIELAEELNPETTYFTHMSHKMGKHELVQAELPETINLAYDGLKIEC